MSFDKQAEELAGQLTEAQRAAILFIGRGPYDHGISLFSTFWDRAENAGLLKVIRDTLKLTSTDAPDARGNGMGPVERLTPLGLAVRQHIQEQANVR
jgi:hypothetical protein